jgi:hypothetical protein
VVECPETTMDHYNTTFGETKPKAWVSDLYYKFAYTFAGLLKKGTPLMSAQVSFLGDGTTAISIYVSHCAMDGWSMHQFLKSWMKHTRDDDASQVEPTLLGGYEYYQKYVRKTESEITEHESPFVNPYVPESLLSAAKLFYLAYLSGNMRNVVWGIKNKRIQELKQILMAKLPADSGVPFLSTADVLQAILWKVMKALTCGRLLMRY